MSRKHRDREEVYAVVRIDLFHDESTPWPDRVTVKEVVRSRVLADAEVARLNQLAADKECVYFAQATRLLREGASAGPSG